MKSVVITGATGFVGIWLVKELLKENIKVFAIVRDTNKMEKLAENHNPILCPMENIEDLKTILENDIRCLLHWQLR